MFYSLQPHADSTHADSTHADSICPAIKSIEVEVQRRHTAQESQALILRYLIAGKVTDLAIPERTMPRRADELWQHTCCEAFIASLDGDDYLELNFSPSTQWAAYRFSNYREGMRIAADVESPRIKVVQSDSRLEMEIAVEVRHPIFVIPDEQNIQASMRMGLCAVIEERNGCKSYWALTHPPGKPDFHRRSSFTSIVL